MPLHKDRRVNGFHQDSLPYLVPTEHPWEALAGFPLNGRRILTVAGSGDIPVYMASHHPASLEAVDVSRGACFLTELKRAAYRRLSRREFLRFFFGGMELAGPLLDDTGEAAAWDVLERASLYRTLRQDLSAAAQNFLDARIGASPAEVNPFAEFLRPTDVCHVSLLPPVGSEEAYGVWASGARRNFPVHCRSLEDFVRETKSCFDLVYTSNVLEYIRTRHVMDAPISAFRTLMGSFWQSLDRILAPGGYVAFYLCQGHETKAFARMLKELAPPRPLRYKRHLVPVTLRPKALPGAVWRHAVVFYEKASSEGNEAT